MNNLLPNMFHFELYFINVKKFDYVVLTINREKRKGKGQSRSNEYHARTL